ncbi:peptide chain release factor N(5)-glutamine methyltransferase [bacterium]|nr:peptide chain release factor N(5)-glutamine methyltransferase [bacterium]OIO86546.1 MAG: protein-(glutamine-N5) methyltransferase, release factor-specific [Anaerolineae bacterium CG2_30_58_95]PIU91562.1 MAG: peptide chain release factor N(5)-glutamine methyltransferase [Anaerolineae bacterium CG06_land_8_20_14_3_00_57_67]PIW20149.1 MAG: peptide chain release factor N(5)-glutamine methyltransferase [Anaerolineae bacterium CG17_big_fil_post_rev_8_21_14_2_50_57_27]PJH74773.1 MAG: peptide chain 
MTVGDLLLTLPTRLGKFSDTPALDEQVLLAHVLGKPRAWVLAHPEATLTPKQECALEEALLQLESGVPLPYVLGKWEFFGLEFEVTPEVLIPRPETELLVERAVSWLRQRLAMNRQARDVKSAACPGRQAREADLGRLRAVDVGAGSGCIAIALAVNVAGLQIIATDISQAAIKVAERNAVKFGVSERVEFFCCDLFPSEKTFNVQPSTFNLIVANLPYIPTETLHGLRVYGREPTVALDGGADGLDVIRRLLAEAPRRLSPGGLILLEIEASQGAKVLSLAHDAFTEAKINLHQDLAGRDRLIEIAL